MHAVLRSTLALAVFCFSPLLAQQASPGSSTISVLSYGATGDGKTDDTDAINKAIKACVSKPYPYNGCTLYFPSGIYITTGLTMQSYVHIKGDGWATSVIQLKPATASDVLTIPIDTFNFSIVGVTLDGNAAKGGRGNCLTASATSTSPVVIDPVRKRTAASTAYKFGYIQQAMFSNCSADGLHINLFNYGLFVDAIYAYNNGVYGLNIQGTDSMYSNFVAESNGTSGLHVAGSNNKFSNAKVIWNGSINTREAAVFVPGDRNTFTAIEVQDNYTNGFSISGTDDQFLGCLADTNGYVPGNINASSRVAAGFIIGGKGGVYLGNKVTSYRGRLPDGNYTTEWPYTITSTNQSKIDISYDSANKPPATPAGDTASPTAGQAACIKSGGPPVVIGSCSTAITSTGACTCN